MKVAVLTANLGNFDTPVVSVPQILGSHYGDYQIKGHCFTDKDFPPIVGLTPRLQYRIPKLFGWEMKPGADIYLWHDGSMSLQHSKSVEWFLDKLGDSDIALFKHPWRNTIREEVAHIEEKLQQGNEYITSRYGGGLHKEQYDILLEDGSYIDDILFTSTAFIYRNTQVVQDMMRSWWYYQSRYFTCDQVILPYVVKNYDLKLSVIEDNQFKSQYISLVSHHK